jgi:hypothetical protein
MVTDAPLGRLSGISGRMDMFPICSPSLVVVHRRGCAENSTAPVETMPSQPIATKCPLRREHRRYLPSEVFLGAGSHTG